MLQFERPSVLFALALLPLVHYILKRRGAQVINFPAIQGISGLPQTLRQRCAPLPRILRYTGLALLIAAAAEPRWNGAREVTRGLAIELVLDRSSSMDIQDMDLDAGKYVSRLTVVKRVARDFVFGNYSNFRGRPSDMIGLIAFAADPLTLAPLTLSHDSLRPAIDSLQAATGGADGTAIGDAIAKAAAKLQIASTIAAKNAIRSKVIVLITDGENNLGDRTPDEAAQLAVKWGVKIYVVAIRPDEIRIKDGTSAAIQEMLALASPTGGLVREIRNGSALEAVISEIDKLEASDLADVRINDGDRGMRATLSAGAIALLLELFLSWTWLRRVP